MARKSVLLLAKTGYIIRDLLMGKFADELIKDMDLIAAVPDPNDDILKEFIKGKPITLIPFYCQESPTTLFQKYFGVQHWIYRFKQIEKNNSSLEIVARLWEPGLSGKKKQLVNFMLYVGKLVNKLHLMSVVEKLFLSLLGRWEITRQWKGQLKKMKPSVVVSTMLTLPSSMFAPSVDLPVLLAARKLGIPCGSLVQSWDNLSSKTYVLPVWLGRYWTWSDHMTEEFIRFNPRIRNEFIKAVGSPHFDFHIDSEIIESKDGFMATLGLDISRPYILIGTGLRSWLPNEPVTVLNLAKLLKTDIPELQIVLRWHPKDDGSRWMEYLDCLKELGVIIQKQNLSHHMDAGGFTPPKEFFHEQVNTIRYAKVIINSASSMTVDSAILNRPIISIGYDAISEAKFPEGRAWFYNNSEHFGALVKTGGVWVVRSEDECMEAIKTYLKNPGLYANGRRLIVEKVTGIADGMAGIRLADEVCSLSNRQYG